MQNKSIFHRIVSNENEYTQLLCNMLQRDPSLVAGLLDLVDGQFRDRIKIADIRPQVRLNEFCQADLLIQSDISPKLCVLFELKTVPYRPLEETQKLLGESKSYQRWLEQKKAEEYDAWLVYLVPGDWKYRHSNKKEIEGYKGSRGERAINVRQIYWDNVLQLFSESDPRTRSPIIQEFRLLLMEGFDPINFSGEEIDFMFSSEFPMGTIVKLNAVIEGLRTRFDKKEAKSVSVSYEFGFSLSDGKREMFVGLSQEFWDAGHHYPISFGVPDSEARVKDAFSEAFEKEYGEKPISVAAMEWTMGGIPHKDFIGFETSDAINEIWEKLAPIWKSVKEAQ